jgi:hypothetical protein
MNTIRKEVRELITLNERIQSALAQGDRMTDDETELIQVCANELLACVPRTEGLNPECHEWDMGNEGKELLSADALREIRYHTVDTNGECVLDVTGPVCRIDKHEQVRVVEGIDETAGCRVVPKTDVGRFIFHNVGYGSVGQPAEEHHEGGL